MKLVRHGQVGKERPGLIDSSGAVRDLSSVCDDFGELNGKRVQDSSTNDMIFSVAKLISDTSQYVILQPGDVIAKGVGLGMKPEKYLKPGDVMRLGIDGLGIQEQRVLRWGEQ